MTFYSLRDYYYFGYLKSWVFADKFGFPHEIVKYVKSTTNLGDDDVILECNQPILYYYTDRKGLSYGDKKMKSVYRHSRSKEKAFWVLKDRLKVKYILTTKKTQKIHQKILNYRV